MGEGDSETVMESAEVFFGQNTHLVLKESVVE